MRCARCGTESIPGKPFCPGCGARVAQTCVQCGEPIDAGFRFCPACGAPVGTPAVPGPVPPGPVAPNRGNPEPQPEAANSPPPGPPLRAGIEAGDGERKLVTVLFCDLVGSTAIAERLDPEEYHEILQEYLGPAFAEVYRFEGVVTQMAGDGLMALFGAPVAHEDAPQRAVRAALAIRSALGRLGARLKAERGIDLAARIGIHTGPVVVGTMGNDAKMDYTAIGDTTNLAARLQTLAEPGGILVSEATFRLVRGHFDLQRRNPVEVKGKREPVIAYEVLGPRTATTPIGLATAHGLTPLVGRSAELAQIEACYAQLAARLPQVVAIVGEAGSGKSRLLYELKQRLAGVSAAILEARCSALDQMAPYHPWTTMLRAYFGIGPQEDAAATAARVAARVGEWPADLRCAEPVLTRMLSGPGDAGDLPADEVKREHFEAVGKLIKAESRRGPVILLLEDLHWIDESSREMLDRAVADIVCAPVMLVVTHRPECQPRWRPGAVLTVINLRRLTDPEAVAVMRGVAGGALPEDLEQLILKKAEGSPFFTEEITRALLEGGYLERIDGGHRLTRPVEEIQIPDTVQEVIAARLDRLGPDAKRVLQVAAVLGRQFRRDRLAELLADDGIDVGAAIEELERRGVIHRKNLFADDELRFGESLTQEVAYESLLLKQRRQLHERIGQALTAAGGEANPERWAQLAHHFSRSDNRGRALEALLGAARSAERVPSYPSAAHFYRHAWNIATADAGDAGVGTTRLALDAAVGLARMAVIYEVPGLDDAPEILKRAETYAATLGDPRKRAEILSYLGMMLTRRRGEFAAGLALVEEALAIAQRAGPVPPSMLRPLAWAYFLDGRFDVAWRTMQWVVAGMEEAGHDRSHSDVYLGARYLRERIKMWAASAAEAQAAARETYDLAVSAGNRTVQAGMAAMLAQFAFERGDYPESLHWAQRGLEVTEALGFVVAMRLEATLFLATRRLLGQPVPERRQAQLIDEYVGQSGDGQIGTHTIVDALLEIGEVERAVSHARTAAARASGRVPEMITAVALGDALSAAGPAEWHTAADAYDRAADLAEATGARRMLVCARLGAGVLAQRRGDTVGGAWRLRQALALARDLGMVRYGARAAAALGTAPAQPAHTEPAGTEHLPDTRH
ncbi:AAA family ATPase [Candidatus Binatia bacterium]|nr:AAA family ATPase [Candidatus Binatia bacterium]